MILQEALRHACGILSSNQTEDPRIESELLLGYVLELNRVQLYLDPDRKLTPQQETDYLKLIKRRVAGEPSAYITGRREFYGLEFFVGRSVLIPRPETELLVDKVLELASPHPASAIADIGTGCGAIAVSLAVKLPRAKIYATDISSSALEVARRNAEKHGVAGSLALLQGDLLDPLPQPVDIIVANLPYVKKLEIPQSGVLSFEPRLALDGGDEGLEKIFRLCRQVKNKLCPRGCLLLEVGQGQAGQVAALLRKIFPENKVDITADLSGIERMVSLLLT